MNLDIKFLICLFIAINVTYSQTCKYVKNLELSYRTTEYGDWTARTINGCIDRAALPDTNIREIHIDCRNLKQIEQLFLRNVESLEKLWIIGGKFETIEPGAFQNLPKLTEIYITNSALKEVKKGVFDALLSVTDIHLFLNEISYIEDGAFANLPYLRVINLNDNRCEYMRKEWFTNSTSTITRFFMAGNTLRQIPSRMFESWRKLEWFDVNTNNISVIHDKAFKDVSPVIKNLNFHFNRLTSISKESFSHPLHIEELRLSANLFNYLPEEFIKNVKIDSLYVHGNPFKCSCLDQLHRLLYRKGVILGDSKDVQFYKSCYSTLAPVCVVFSNFSSYCQETVDSDITKIYLTYLKKIGYDHTLDGKCANFDVLRI